MHDKLLTLLWMAPLAFAGGWAYSWVDCWRYENEPLPGEHKRFAVFAVAFVVWLELLVGEVPVWIVPYQDFLFWAGLIGIIVVYAVSAINAATFPKNKRKKKPKRISGTELRTPPDKVDT